MKEACEITGFSYETLKYYCNIGLVPHVRRDENNRRVFSDRDIAWIRDLHFLKKCHMTIKEMKQYMDWCMEGPSTIQIRKDFLTHKKDELEKEISGIQKSIDFIDWKQKLYDEFLDGSRPYYSNLTESEKKDD